MCRIGTQRTLFRMPGKGPQKKKNRFGSLSCRAPCQGTHSPKFALICHGTHTSKKLVVDKATGRLTLVRMISRLALLLGLLFQARAQVAIDLWTADNGLF